MNKKTKNDDNLNKRKKLHAIIKKENHFFHLHACFSIKLQVSDCAMTTFLIYHRSLNSCWGIQQAVIQNSAELFNQHHPSVSIRPTPGSTQTVPVLTAALHLQLILGHMHNTDSQVSIYQVKSTLLSLREFPHASTIACLAELSRLA